ncbi:hypothetical protein NQ314_000661 [Rhamnusium bicolor]|uniref:Regulatory protein zeste n=1 Tax=Rhamnusium bicolor TaxID=1586634 RepID=A0AAV8ZW26_9CUCU|nr:hypothetical protein NQ314_000661 [Rhamnusium bicolor]
MAEAKRRGKRTSQEQMTAIVDFIEVHKILLSGKCHPLQAKELEEKWSELSEILNNIPNGARKDVKQWKTFFSEWKSKTRKKARLAKEHLVKTGGGSYSTEQLNEIETRLINVCGWVSIIGCNELPEEIDPDAESIFERDIEVSTIEIDLINEATEFEVLDEPAVESSVGPSTSSGRLQDRGSNKSGMYKLFVKNAA